LRRLLAVLTAATPQATKDKYYAARRHVYGGVSCHPPANPRTNLEVQGDNVLGQLLVLGPVRAIQDEVNEIKAGEQRRGQLDIVNDGQTLVP
jgi:hypothetical protein